MVHKNMPMMICELSGVRAGLRRAGRWLERRLTGSRWPGLCLLLLAVLAAGCSSSGKRSGTGAGVGMRPPKTPVFLNGPMALLLTNAEGFSAHAVLESGAPANGVELAAGELLGQGGKLLFAPGVSRTSTKRSRAEDFAFIWDVAVNRGCVVNDPLQGYAPVSYGRLFTNLAASVGLKAAATENVAGHPCQRVEVTVAANDGSASVFQVWRATDLKGLPVRIAGASDGTLVTLTLSKARLEPLPADLFQPPNGFTKYDSTEAMINELVSRQAKRNQHPSYQPEESEVPVPRESRSPSRM